MHHSSTGEDGICGDTFQGTFDSPKNRIVVSVRSENQETWGYFKLLVTSFNKGKKTRLSLKVADTVCFMILPLTANLHTFMYRPTDISWTLQQKYVINWNVMEDNTINY